VQDDFLGEMPQPTEQVYDIYVEQRTSELLVPTLFDNNQGFGYTESEASAKVAALVEQKRRLGVEEFEYLVRLRGFDDLPKCTDENDWGEPDPDYVEPEWMRITEKKFEAGKLILPYRDRSVETVSLDAMGEAEQRLDDWLG
jgi:hypothetical protein